MKTYIFGRQEVQHAFYLKIIIVVLSILSLTLLISLITVFRATSPLIEKESQNHSSLVFLQVLFRHGERTPILRTGYPNDPYRNDTYEPHGVGTLTLRGKRTLYNVGKFLNGYYQEYLGDYNRDLVYAQASPVPRCINSLLLVLAGLFPPSTNTRIDDALNWQPIPYNYNSIKSDTQFLYFINCKKYIKLKNEMGRKTLNGNKSIKTLAEYLKYHSGANITTIMDVLSLYTHLATQQALGYKLPQWTERVYPEPLHTYGMMDIDVATKTDVLKKLSGGFMLKEILDAITLKIKNSPQMIPRKLQLYGGHDFNIANLLGTLGFKLRENPTYGAFLCIELHKVDTGFAIKLLYQDYTSELPRPVRLPECEEMCPLERFIELFGKYQASPEECEH